MTIKIAVRFLFIALLLGVFTAALFAQQVELYPNAGGFWPRHTNSDGMRNDMSSEGIYGLKGGVLLNPNIQLEGDFGYINHFESRMFPTDTDTLLGNPRRTIYGVLYNVNGAWNFGGRHLMGSRVTPYLTAGLGGLTTEVRHADAAFVAGAQDFLPDPLTGSITSTPGRSTTILNDGDTFLTVNYGGGIKAMRLWGPVGLRADIRGRTIPNFYGKSMYWPELTGGLLFTWGER